MPRGWRGEGGRRELVARGVWKVQHMAAALVGSAREGCGERATPGGGARMAHLQSERERQRKRERERKTQTCGQTLTLRVGGGGAGNP